MKGTLFLRNLGYLIAPVPKYSNSSTLKRWAFLNILAEHNWTAYATSICIFVALKQFEIIYTVVLLSGFSISAVNYALCGRQIM